MAHLTGRRALVCGSTRGIGRAVAQRFAALGARVTLLARDADALSRVRDELGGPAAGHHALAADFADPAGVDRAIAEHVEQTRAEGPFQVLLNNSGGPAPGPLLDADPDSLRAGFEGHVVCFHLLARRLVPGMMEAGWGRVINIISTSVKSPIPNLGVSNTIRAAVANWSKTLAAELAPHGITVNNILPGATETDRLRKLVEAKARDEGVEPEEIRARMARVIPARRFAQPEEIAAAAAFLASDDAAYVTGINLPVDGGRTSSL